MEEIGVGAEGRVWRGRWHHTSVAVKEMRPQSASFARIASVAWELRGGSGGGNVGASAGGRQQDGALAAQLTPETQVTIGTADVLTKSQLASQTSKHPACVLEEPACRALCSVRETGNHGAPLARGCCPT